MGFAGLGVRALASRVSSLGASTIIRGMVYGFCCGFVEAMTERSCPTIALQFSHRRINEGIGTTLVHQLLPNSYDTLNPEPLNRVRQLLHLVG